MERAHLGHEAIHLCNLLSALDIAWSCYPGPSQFLFEHGHGFPFGCFAVTSLRVDAGRRSRSRERRREAVEEGVCDLWIACIEHVEVEIEAGEEVLVKRMACVAGIVVDERKDVVGRGVEEEVSKDYRVHMVSRHSDTVDATGSGE